jgi:hypothetical protein
VLSGRSDVAAEALEQLSESTQASGTDWALGVEALSRALLSCGDSAEAFYREAIEHLDRSPVRPEAARAHLLYGEWLRRDKPARGRASPAAARNVRLTELGISAFRRAGGLRLAATGETVRKRTVSTGRSTSRPRRLWSLSSPLKAVPTRRSGRKCSSAPAPSSTTCAKSSGS